MNALWPALIVAGPAFLGPWIAIRANGRERRKDQQATWDRDDQVAEQAAKAASLLLAAQQDAIARTDQVAEHVAAATRDTATRLAALDAQGRAIHTLVNQKLTDVTAAALAATVAMLTALEQSAADQRELGRPPSADAVARIEQARRDVSALEGVLTDRRGQQRIVDDAARSTTRNADAG